MSGQGGNNEDAQYAWVVLIALILILGALVWKYNHAEIKSAVRWIRWAELQVVLPFVDEDYTVEWRGQKQSDLRGISDYIEAIDKTSLDGNAMSFISTMAMAPLKIPIIVLLAIMGLWNMFWGPGAQYRRALNLDGLIYVQSKTFPFIAPFVKFNPSNQPVRPPGALVPVDLPAFAEALGPEEWLAFTGNPVPDGKVDPVSAAKAFAKQLGPRWGGPQRLSAYKQIFLAACCLKAARKRADADRMMGMLAGCWDLKKGIDLSKHKKLIRDARKILKNRDLSGKTLSQINQHGYETTALMRALAIAREEGGVMAPAQFVWLRAQDRNLWYALNNLGRQSFHMEALGAMAHYKVEKLTRRPIYRPKVEDAVKMISEYMESSRARPIPKLDYKGSKKRGVKKPV